jgi:hypothetical protein
MYVEATIAPWTPSGLTAGAQLRRHKRSWLRLKRKALGVDHLAAYQQMRRDDMPLNIRQEFVLRQAWQAAAANRAAQLEVWQHKLAVATVIDGRDRRYSVLAADGLGDLPTELAGRIGSAEIQAVAPGRMHPVQRLVEFVQNEAIIRPELELRIESVASHELCQRCGQALDRLGVGRS